MGNKSSKNNTKKLKKSKSLNDRDIEIDEKAEKNFNRDMMKTKRLMFTTEEVKTDNNDGKRKGKKHKGNIKGGTFLDKDKILENVTIRNHEMNNLEKKFLIQALSTNSLFFAFSDEEKEQILSVMVFGEVKEGKYLFKQGDKASSYFILTKGKLDLFIDKVKKRSLERGEGFGEMALLYDKPRSASLQASEKSWLWILSRSKFRKAITILADRDFQDNRMFIEEIQFFQNFTLNQRDAITRILIKQAFKKGEYIIRQGDVASAFFMIKKGVVEVMKEEQVVREMKEGEFFGEQALFQDTIRAASIRAKEFTITLSLGREHMIEIFGKEILGITYMNIHRWAFNKSPILTKLTELQLAKLNEAVEFIPFEKNEVILAKGSKIDSVIVIIDGELVKKGANVTFKKGALIGDIYLMNEAEV